MKSLTPSKKDMLHWDVYDGEIHTLLLLFLFFMLLYYKIIVPKGSTIINSIFIAVVAVAMPLG